MPAIVAPVSLRNWRREKPFPGPVMDSRPSRMRSGSFWGVMVFPFLGTRVKETKGQYDTTSEYRKRFRFSSHHLGLSAEKQRLLRLSFNDVVDDTRRVGCCTGCVRWNRWRLANHRCSRWSRRWWRRRFLGFHLLELGLKPGIFPLSVLDIGFQFQLGGSGSLEPLLEVRDRGLPG